MEHGPNERELRDLIATLWLYIGRWHVTQLTTEQKDLLYDVVEADHRESGASTTPMYRWWRA